MERTLTCIICPRGCTLTVTGERDALKVEGNACPKGAQYAIDECTHPVRTVTSVVRVANREDTMVSVKTATPVPKECIFEVMEAIRAASVDAPVAAGAVLLTVCGAEIVATKTIA